MRQNGNRWFLILVAGGALSGALCGWFLGERMLAIRWMGDLFLNALSLLVVPLVVPSLIVGIAGLGDVRKLGRLGLTTFLFYTLTTFFAVALGLVMSKRAKNRAGILPTEDAADALSTLDKSLSRATLKSRSISFQGITSTMAKGLRR